MGAAGNALHVMHPVTAGLQLAMSLVHIHKHGVGTDNFSDRPPSVNALPAVRATIRMTERDTLRVSVLGQQVLLQCAQRGHQ